MQAFPRSRGKQISLVLLAVGFTFVGVQHFVAPDPFLRIMPPYLPAQLALVYVSGAFEVLGGLGLLWGRSRQVARIGLLALLVAVYPANFYMLQHPELFPEIPEWGLWVRMPMQFVMAGWIWWAARAE